MIRLLKMTTVLCLLMTIVSCDKPAENESLQNPLLGKWRGVSTEGIVYQNFFKDGSFGSISYDITAENIDYTLEFKEDEYIVNGNYDLLLLLKQKDQVTPHVIEIPYYNNVSYFYTFISDNEVTINGEFFNNPYSPFRVGNINVTYEIIGNNLKITYSDHLRNQMSSIEYESLDFKHTIVLERI